MSTFGAPCSADCRGLLGDIIDLRIMMEADEAPARAPKARAALQVIAGVMLPAGIVMSLLAVAEHAEREVSALSDPQRVSGLRVVQPRHEIVAAVLHEGQKVQFHGCASDGFHPGAWPPEHVAFEVWLRDPAERMLRAPVTATRLERARRGSRGACILLGAADSLGTSGEFSVAIAPAEAQGSAIEDVEVWAQILAVVPLGPTDPNGPLLIWLGALLLAASWLLRPSLDALASFDAEPGPITRRLVARPAMLVVIVVLAYGVAGVVTDQLLASVLGPSSSSALLGGTLRALTALVLAVWPAKMVMRAAASPAGGAEPDVDDPVAAEGARGASALLGLRGPARWPWLVLPLMLPLGCALRVAIAMATAWIPATGVAPIEALVSAPSGMLATMAVAFLAPVAEEVFYRGFVFGALERSYGTLLAAVCSATLFALVHLPQTWGAWSGFTGVALAGIAFTLIRVVTRSTAASAAAHLAHNFIIMNGVILQAMTR